MIRLSETPDCERCLRPGQGEHSPGLKERRARTHTHTHTSREVEGGVSWDFGSTQHPLAPSNKRKALVPSLYVCVCVMGATGKRREAEEEEEESKASNGATSEPGVFLYTCLVARRLSSGEEPFYKPSRCRTIASVYILLFCST